MEHFTVLPDFIMMTLPDFQFLLRIALNKIYIYCNDD